MVVTHQIFFVPCHLLSRYLLNDLNEILIILSNKKLQLVFFPRFLNNFTCNFFVSASAILKEINNYLGMFAGRSTLKDGGLERDLA